VHDPQEFFSKLWKGWSHGGDTVVAMRLAFFLFLIVAPLMRSQTAPSDEQVNRRVEQLLPKMTLEEKIDLLGGVDGFFIRGVPTVGLPPLKTSDGPVGARNDGPATTMAGGIALAASWNVALAKQVGLEIGRDARARGVHFMLGPGVNIYVAPMNGRNFEYFGEDPFLASRLAVAYIEGMQSQGVSATVKHFMGNSSEFDRHNIDSRIDERSMREIYLPAFEAAVQEAHVGSVMGSYNLTNGEHLSQNAHLNVDVAKKEWGFDGIMMSDWLSTYDGVAAANGGLDLEMPAGAYMNRKNLLPAIETGKVTVAAIDDKVRRILRTAVRFGWLDRDQVDRSVPLVNGPGKQTALQAAREGMVLLKNDRGLLPLNKAKIRSIAVIGPDAYPAVPVGGGSAQVRPFAAVSFLQGLSDALGPDVKVYYNRGIATWSQLANSTQFLTAATNGKPGVTVETFGNQDFSGSPASTRVARHMTQRPRFSFADVANIDFGEVFESLNSAQSPSGSSTRWTGYYNAAASGKFEVFTAIPGESGGHRLLIDGNLVLNNWDIRKALVDHTTIELSAGPHKVVFEQFQPARPDLFSGGVQVGIAPEDRLVDPAAKTEAAQADAVVLAVGFDPESESEGGDRTFSLPFGQDELIRQIAAANKNTIVVVTSGGAVDASAWLDRVPALLEAWYPGQEGGAALAEILLGGVNPSGRLPISFDRRWEENPSHDSYYPEPGTRRVVYKNGVFVGYRGYDRNGTKPLFPFGYGLSYTSFKYSRLTIHPMKEDASGTLYEVSFDVTNTGSRAGSDVCQLYVGDKHAKVPRPPKELKGFMKVSLAPGETRTVRMNLNRRSFSYYDVDTKAWRADAGEFAVLVGRSSADIQIEGKIVLTNDIAVR
jgi:beta-glucosidase